MMKPLADRVRALERARFGGLLALILLVAGLAGIAFVQWQGRDAAETDAAQQEEKATAGQQSLEALCASGNKAACDAVAELEQLPDSGAEADPNDPEVQDAEIQEPEIQDPEEPDGERQDPETQDPEQQDGDPNDPEIQDPEEQDPEIQDPEIQDPEIDDPDPNDPPACSGEFVCADELAAILAEYAPRSWVIDLLQALGCQLTGIGSEVLTCTITGKP